MLRTVRPRRHGGFTLLELMITIAIIGIMGAIGIPSIMAGKPLRELKSAARDVFGDFMRARSRAVSTYQAHFVCFAIDGIDGNRLWLEQGDQPRVATCNCTPCDQTAPSPCALVSEWKKPLPPTVSFQSVNGVTTGVVSQGFNVDGTAQGGNVMLVNTQGTTYEVSVFGTTGRTRLCRNVCP